MFRKIPVNVPFWSNVEAESRSIVAEQRRDVMKDTLGSTIKRPCLSVFATGLSEIVDGMYYWLENDMVYLASDGDLYSLNESGSLVLVQADMFKTGSDGLHVTWAESTDLTLVTAGATRKLFGANGDRIMQYDKTTASLITSANAPTEAGHIIMFDSYLQSTELSDPKYDESVLYSTVADPLTWAGAYYSADDHPDKLVALHTAWDEISLFGQRQIQTFYNDGLTPFSSISGGNINDGTLSPWTIKQNKTSYFMLNHDRLVVRIDGRLSTEISHAINDIIDGDVDYANAEGELFTLKGKELYLLTINDRTFVYDIKLNEWVGEWGTWDKIFGTYTKFPGRNFINVKPWGLTLCSDKDTGTIYKLDFDTYQDDSVEVRSSVITGWIDHETTREKRVNELRLRLKRGAVSKTTTTQVEPVLLVRWADNGTDFYSNWRTVPLGFKGQTEFYYSLYQLGSYMARKYEFLVTDNTPFSIVDVEEDIEILR